MKQPVIAISGVKNSGKTTLVERLVHALVGRGYRVATIKHDAHAFEPDVPGRDSYRHRAAGAYGSAVFDREKSMVIKNGKSSIDAMIAQFPEADIIVLEGAKQTDWPKIEIVRAGNSSVPVCDPSTLVALATDLPLCVEGVPSVDLNDIDAMVEIILTYFRT